MIQTALGVAISLSGLLAALNLAKPAQSPGDRWLTAWLASVAGAMLCFFTAASAHGPVALAAAAAGNSLVAACSPCLFLYARAIAGEPVRRIVVHFLFPLGNLAFMAALFFAGAADASGMAIVVNANVAPFVAAAPPILIAVSIGYCVFAIRAIDLRIGRAKELSSSWADIRDLAWVRRWAKSAIAFYLAAGGIFAASLFGAVRLELHIVATLSAICVMIAYVGVSGLRETRYFRADALQPAPAPRAMRITANDVDALTAAIAASEVYLTPGVTLPALARAIEWPEDKVSAVLRDGMDMSFFDAINRFRVEQVKRALADAAYEKTALLTLGLEAGFGSKSAFNDAFKQHAGMTPSQYRRQCRDKQPADF